MYLKTPKIFNRPMDKVEEYEHFVLFIDKKTGIRECFQYWDLTHEIIDNKTYVYDDKGSLVLINDKANNIPVQQSKQMIKNDNRIYALLEDLL